MNPFLRNLLLTLIPFGGLSAGASACSICGCSLSSDWAAQGYPSMPGLQVDVRAEYSDQDSLQSGTHPANRALYPLPNDHELQVDTDNLALWLSADQVFSDHWAVSAQLPSFDRDHATIAAGDTTESTSRIRGIGDARLLARYQVFTLASSWSVQAGFKLPTGGFHQDFAMGPQAGSPLDRGLQLGSGTLDLLAGASRFWREGEHYGCFVQAFADQPLAPREGYLPSTSVQLSAGVRYLNGSAFTPEFQINGRWEGREHGIQADTANSGSSTVYASPGASVSLGRHMTGYLFVQVPVYQRVNGLQLEPHWVLAAGIRFRR